MSTRRSSRKKIDYSQFDDGKSESDDDFQDSPNAPPTKKAKTATKRVEKKKTEMKKRETKEGKSLKIEKESKQAQISSHDKNRRSRDDKLFERELQAALELSKKQSPQAIKINEDESGIINEDKRSQKSCERIEETTVSVSSDSNDNDEKDDESEYEASEEELDESNSEDDDDDDFNVESDDEFKISTKKNKKVKVKTAAKVQDKVKNVASNMITVNQDIIAKTKTAGKPTAAKNSSLAPVALTPKIQSNTCTKLGFRPSSGSLALACPAQRNTGCTPLQTPGSATSGAIGNLKLNGVTVKRSGPSGLRLGLSRNVRVSKPLHSNIRLKTS